MAEPKKETKKEDLKEQLKKRPMLTDPKEFDIIRSIHFESHKPRGFDMDPTELLDRQQQGKYRNQSR